MKPTSPRKTVKAPRATKAVKAAKVAKPAKAAAAPKAPKPRVVKPKAPRKTSPTLQLLKQVVQALDAKKAERLQILDVSEQSSITDYLVLASGTSDPHLRALRVELEKVLDASHIRILGMDATKGSGWTVVDAFEIMIHLFTYENRDKYRMETLWKDATEVSIEELLKS